MVSSKIKALRLAKDMTLEELANLVGTSKQTIHRYENGIISNIPREKIEALSRALGTTPASLMGWSADASFFSSYNNIVPITTKRLPVLGSIACGEPIYAEEEHESFVSTDANLDADFCLRAQGDSMIGARIYDGDMVFIKAQEAVDNGEVAAVIINDEATLKRVYYYPSEGKLILSPENPKYPPLVYLGEELNSIKILGKAVAFQSRVS